MKLATIKAWYMENRDACHMLLGVILGLICGFTLKAFFTLSPQVLTYISLPAKILVRMFMLLLVPLIVASLATGMTAIKAGQNKRMVGLSLLIIVISLSIAAVFGTTMISVIKPGVIDGDYQEIDNNTQMSDEDKSQLDQMTSEEDLFYDVLMNLVPDNIVGATIMTHYTAMEPINPFNVSQGYKKVPRKSYQTNLLGLVVISFMLGFSVLFLEERAHTIKALLEETNLIVTEIIMFLIKFMPFAIFCFMCVDAVNMKAPGVEILIQILWHGATSLITFAAMALVFYPAVYLIIVHKNPFKLYLNIMPAILVALGSSSSAMTLPMTMRCMEEKYKLEPSISQFFLPLGMTLHMPGTASFCPMITIFIAQVHGITPSWQVLATLIIYSVIMSMAFPSTPSQGGMVFFVTLAVLIGIKNPLEAVVYIKAIDLFIGRVRTSVNIIGDCFLAAILEKIGHFEEEKDSNEDIELRVTPHQLS